MNCRPGPREFALGGALRALVALGSIPLRSLAFAGDEPPPAASPAADRPRLQMEFPSPINRLEKAIDYSIDGMITNRYRLRWTSGESDQDLYQTLSLRAGDPQKNRVSAVFLGRLSEDIDGGGNVEGFEVFDSIDDTHDHAVAGRFYSGYVDLRRFGWMDRAHLEFVRAGRQSFDESVETFVFDGGRLDTRPFKDLQNLRLTAYGGLPAHIYESSPSGDAVAGAGMEARTLPGGRGRVDWTYIADRRDDGHFENHIVSVALWQMIGSRFDLHGRYNLLDGETRDYLVRGNYREASLDLLLQASFHQVVMTIRELSTELDPYFSMVQELRPYWEINLLASKGLGEHFVIDGGVDARELRDESDEGTYNHDFRRYFVTPATVEWPLPGMSLSVTGEIWDSEVDEVTSFGAELRQKLFKVFQVAGGTYYSLFKFDQFTAEEKTRVRTFYGKLEYRLAKDVRLHALYEFEKDDEFEYHTVDVGLRCSF